MSERCSYCGHQYHGHEACDMVPWDGNPYGHDCGCLPEEPAVVWADGDYGGPAL